MNINDLDEEAEFVKTKKALLTFVSNRYKGLQFDLQGGGYDEGACRTGLESPRKRFCMDLIGACDEVVIQLNLEIRRHSLGGGLVVERRSPDDCAYGKLNGMLPTMFARIGGTDVKIGDSYELSELDALGLDYDTRSSVAPSPFAEVQRDMDQAIVFVFRRLTAIRAKLRGQRRAKSATRPTTTAAKAKPREATRPTPRAAEVPHRGRDLEID